jgi:hypothetical protein
MRVVISQSMLFPWVGLLEQVQTADVFVHYDDVQFSKGSFVNRVQVKTPVGTRWMTVPTHDLSLGQRICDVATAPAVEWAGKHLSLLRSSFSGAPFAADAIALAETVYAEGHSTLGSLARASLLSLIDYFGLEEGRQFVDVQSLAIGGSSSQRVLDVVKRLGGDVYVTGHGAARYLDHGLFAREGVAVQYMRYGLSPYPQLHGEFTPYVSALDLVANCGRGGARFICSHTISSEEFLHGSA